MKQDKSAVVLIYNSKGEMALQLRSQTDSKYPGHWDFAAAGGIEVGEEPDTAAHRELKEEIGIETDLEFLGELLYEDEKGQDQLYIYKGLHDGPLIADGIEVEKTEYFSVDTIQNMLDAGEKFHPEFPWFWEQGIIKTT